MSTSQGDANVVSRYWYPEPEGFRSASDRLLETSSGRIERYELCRNDLNEPVFGFRTGQGLRNVVLLGGVHGHEPAGPCGLLAVMDGLLSGKVPGTDEPFEPAAALFREFAIDLIPMANPDAHRRFAAQVSESYPSLTFDDGPEDCARMLQIHSEPGVTLKKGRPPHYTPAEVIDWRKTGKPMGTLFTEEGVEMWRDWAHGRSIQIVCLRELLRLRQPALFVDVHDHQVGNSIFVPAGLRSDEDFQRHARLAEAAYDAMARAGIPCHRAVTPYIRNRPDLDCSTNWAYRNLGSLQYLVEIDWGYRWGTKPDSHPAAALPPLTKAQIVMSVWHTITAFLEAYPKG